MIAAKALRAAVGLIESREGRSAGKLEAQPHAAVRVRYRCLRPRGLWNDDTSRDDGRRCNYDANTRTERRRAECPRLREGVATHVVLVRGFRVEVQRKPNKVIQRGYVFAQLPSPGRKASGSTTVRLKVSLGA
jgi:hypothetical protein